MHAKSGLRVVLEWKIYRPDSVIAAVMQLKMNSEIQQDVFISHAGPDKSKYVIPIADSLAASGISFWLDSHSIQWGDNVPLMVNEGLRTSRFVLLCLSQNFCERPWPENELSSALATQNGHGQKKLLPLVLNSKERVFEQYPLLAGFAYREYSGDPADVTRDLKLLLNQKKSDNLRVTVRTIHTGKKFDLVVPPRVSNTWVMKHIATQFRLRPEADFGELVGLRVRYILVDARAREHWEKLPHERQRKIHVMIKVGDGFRESVSESDTFDALEIESGTVFNVYAIQDEPVKLLYAGNISPSGGFVA